MGLVDYSDSEGSDAERDVSQPAAATLVASKKSNDAQGKAGFQKVVNPSKPNKIKVNLPVSANSTPTQEESVEDARPAKRVKTNGGLSGFNSMLPTPKNQAASSNSSTLLLKGHASGLKRGVSLRTGATPSFTRDPIPESEPEHGIEPSTYEEEESTIPKISEANVHEETENNLLIGEAQAGMATSVKPMVFKPLSVGNKNARKKKPPIPDKPNSLRQNANSAPAEPAPTTANPSPTPRKPKKSLFSTYEPELPSTTSAAADGEYHPLLDEAVAQDQPQVSSAPSSSLSDNAPPTGPKDLNTLADSLGLTAAQRRQLFGRKGQANGAEVASFSVAAEYANNNAMLADEASAAPVHNPVRAIAPGKHSLQQLLNAAHSQKDALEESFAQGKRNKKDAGSKYGW